MFVYTQYKYSFSGRGVHVEGKPEAAQRELSVSGVTVKFTAAPYTTTTSTIAVTAIAVTAVLNGGSSGGGGAS